MYLHEVFLTTEYPLERIWAETWSEIWSRQKKNQYSNWNTLHRQKNRDWLTSKCFLLSITQFPCIFDPGRTRVSQSISLQPFSSAKKTSSFHFVEVLTKLILSCYRYPNIFVPIILDTKTMVVQWWEHSPPTSVARVRILASTPTMCGLSLLLVLSLAPRGFSPDTQVFPSP